MKSHRNPARSLGPALFGGSVPLSVYWVYLVGPSLGAVLAVWMYEMVRGGERYAQGAGVVDLMRMLANA